MLEAILVAVKSGFCSDSNCDGVLIASRCDEGMASAVRTKNGQLAHIVAS